MAIHIFWGCQVFDPTTFFFAPFDIESHDNLTDLNHSVKEKETYKEDWPYIGIGHATASILCTGKKKKKMPEEASFRQPCVPSRKVGAWRISPSMQQWCAASVTNHLLLSRSNKHIPPC